jgi:hypothetical protein
MQDLTSPTAISTKGILFLNEILADPEGYLDSWNLLDNTNVKAFVRAVKNVRAHVTTTLKTPRNQRGKPPFEKATT